MEMSERNISLRVYLQMMYFLSVIGMGGSSVCVCVCVCVEGGVIWLRTPSFCPRISKYMQQIYKNCLDYLLNLAIVRISLEKNMDPPIIGISLARSNLYEIAVKS
jgi:hypothetical protein